MIKTKNNDIVEASSFKDPDSTVLVNNNGIFRKINYSYKDDYEFLMNSGLYEDLTVSKLLIEHSEVENSYSDCYKLIAPQKVFITYPWEWSFSQLKDAAITTLKIQLKALEYNMSLKDANCYNIQFYNNKPLLIDTASFERYKEGTPWVAYKQFCENFLAPLALMSYTDINLNKLLIVNINGIPLDITRKLLPFKAFLNMGIFSHIVLHSLAQTQYSDNKTRKVDVKIPKFSQISLIKSLLNCINHLKLKDFHTEWDDYYNFTNYDDKSFESKKEIILKYKNTINPKIVWDFGANTGLFSRLFSDCAQTIIALDIDPLAVEKNYLISQKEKEENIIPLVYDLSNPSPAIGWDNAERQTLLNRSNKPDVVMALALIHHLRITYNIPLFKIRDYFSKISPYLIIEYIEKEDSQIQKMLLNREDIFNDYNLENFENIFSEEYEILQKDKVGSSNRYLYLMRKK